MPSIYRWGESAERAPFRTGTKVFFIVLSITLVVGGVAWAIKAATLPARSAMGVAERTFDPDNVLYNYEWYKTTKGAYDATLVKYGAAKRALDAFVASAGERSTWTFEDKQEHSRLTQVMVGLEGQIASIAGEYNARSQMMNRALFKDGLIVFQDSEPLPETLALNVTAETR